MKRKAGAVATAAAVAVVVVFGCGGGGGGGSSTTPHVYTGVSTAASLDNTFEGGQIAYGILAASVAGAVGPLQLSPGSDQPSLPRLSAKAAILQAVRRVVPSAGGGGTVLSRAVYTDRYPGAEGGTFNLKVTTGVWTNTQTEYVTRIDVTFQSFDDVVDGVANPISGTMSIVPDSWLGNGDPAFFVATFDLHMAFAPGASGRITGSLDYDQVSFTDLRHIYTWNDTLISDEQTNIQIWWNPLVEIDEGGQLMTITASSKVYLSPFGYVTITPIQPFSYPTGTEFMPVSGTFLMTGASNRATITVSGTSPEVLVELDRSGDGSIDSSATYSWEELVI